jgi:hypothetical protein
MIWSGYMPLVPRTAIPWSSAAAHLLCSPNVITVKKNSAAKHVAFKVKISAAQMILLTKLKLRNLGMEGS